MTTFTETAASPQEIRDKICAWLDEKAKRSKNRSLAVGILLREKDQLQREAYCYSEAAHFWRGVVITTSSE